MLSHWNNFISRKFLVCWMRGALTIIKIRKHWGWASQVTMMWWREYLNGMPFIRHIVVGPICGEWEGIGECGLRFHIFPGNIKFSHFMPASARRKRKKKNCVRNKTNKTLSPLSLRIGNERDDHLEESLVWAFFCR